VHTFKEVHNGKTSSITPLHYAVKRRWQAVVSLLLEHGANPNARTKADNTPLHYLAQAKRNIDKHNKETALNILKILLAYGAKTNVKNNRCKTVLDLALEKSEMRENSKLINLLKEETKKEEEAKRKEEYLAGLFSHLAYPTLPSDPKILVELLLEEPFTKRASSAPAVMNFPLCWTNYPITLFQPGKRPADTVPENNIKRRRTEK